MRSTCHCIRYAVLLTCLVLLVSSCGNGLPGISKPTITTSASPSPTVTLRPTQTSTPTQVAPMAVLLAPAGADETLVNNLQTFLNDMVSAAGLRWQVRQGLSPADLIPALRLVVAVPPDPGLGEMAANAPETHFVAVGLQGLDPASNLTVIGETGAHPDQQGFIAGVIAAMLAPDWRVGVISLSDTIPGRSARTGFLNGVEYFCGLCRPAHPPFYEYPLYVELPSTASAPEWQEAANYMVDHYAQTVYVYPEAGDENMLSILADAGVNIISSGMPPQAASSTWALSLDTDPLALIQNLVSDLLDGSQVAGQSISVPIQFTNINPGSFTPGKQRLAGEILSDLQHGYIDTGVDLTTGEFRP